MPIPPFDANLVLPPHLGDPTNSKQLSPYPCTVLELCQRFATTPQRRTILQGLLDFRQKLVAMGFRGFQWVDGSFSEDIEKSETRPPKDLDLITLYWAPSAVNLPAVLAAEPILVDPAAIRTTFRLDHYFVDIAYNPIVTVEQTRYWVLLFSHRRDGIWKGILQIDLNTPVDDAQAADHLRNLK